jgi:hypothetical protein
MHCPLVLLSRRLVMSVMVYSYLFWLYIQLGLLNPSAVLVNNLENLPERDVIGICTVTTGSAGATGKQWRRRWSIDNMTLPVAAGGPGRRPGHWHGSRESGRRRRHSTWARLGSRSPGPGRQPVSRGATGTASGTSSGNLPVNNTEYRTEKGHLYYDSRPSTESTCQRNRTA